MTAFAQVPSEYHSAVTRDGYEQLRDELTVLTTINRAQVSDRLRDAREQGGEFADNLELIDALEDQELLERRITTLEAVLTAARVIDHPPRDGTVGVGSSVRLHDVDSGNTTEYLIVGSIEADPVERKLSSESPVGRALLGRRAGDILDVNAPRGTMRFRILEVHKDARREANLTETRSRAHPLNAERV
jgi:transcription elongation factor GreA